MMDRTIGRPSYKIKGSVSANNYLEFSNLRLIGHVLNFQLCLQGPTVATFHIEVVTTSNVTLRLSVSTLYDGDQPRFLGRSVRLPLPVVSGWFVLSIDLRDILAKYCSIGSATKASLAFTKKITICSNVLFRDVVSMDQPLSADFKHLPKELTVKPQQDPENNLKFVNLADYCTSLSSASSLGGYADSPATGEKDKEAVKIKVSVRMAKLNAAVEKQQQHSETDKDRNNLDAEDVEMLLRQAGVRRSDNLTNNNLPGEKANIQQQQQQLRQVTQQSPPPSPSPATSPAPVASASASLNKLENPRTAKNSSAPAVEGQGKAQISNVEGDDRSIVSSGRGVLQPAHNRTSEQQQRQRQRAVRPNDDIMSRSSTPGGGAAGTAGTAAAAPFTPFATTIAPHTDLSKPTVLSKALSTPRHQMMPPPTHSSTALAAAGNTVRYNVPDVPTSDKLLCLERLLGYNGGAAVLLFGGQMLLYATGPLIVMIDISDKDGSSDAAAARTGGLWRAFGPGSSSSSSCSNHPVASLSYPEGYRQAFLRGHSNHVGIIEVSEREAYMATGETNVQNGLLILWSVSDGRRVASMRPHSDSIVCVGFNPDNSMLVTVGTDAQHRFQIIVWDMQLLLLEKSTVLGSASNINGLAIARQISEFDIVRIRFSPFEECGLVSCGRENVRFWRVRKGHLPGRPVLLGEYARGYIFNDMAFHNDEQSVPVRQSSKRSTLPPSSSVVVALHEANSPGTITTTTSLRPTVYVSSNKGVLLRINCQNDQLLCAFQLHSDAIHSLCVHSSYAVTGSADLRLRVWPLDFTDFLLEAQHEGVVSTVRVAADGRRLVVGTTAGTLGVLNVSEHSYSTVLRSHVGSVLYAARRGAEGLEFATVGSDKTVRVWDAASSTQVIEFSSSVDEPRCCSYHPSDHFLACGFASGFLRIFDVSTATAMHERKTHAAPVTELQYFKISRDPAELRSTYEGQVHNKLEDKRAKELLLLAVAGLDGVLIIFDADHYYAPLLSYSFAAVMTATPTPQPGLASSPLVQTKSTGGNSGSTTTRSPGDSSSSSSNTASAAPGGLDAAAAANNSNPSLLSRIHMCISADGQFIALATSTVSSLVILECRHNLSSTTAAAATLAVDRHGDIKPAGMSGTTDLEPVELSVYLKLRTGGAAAASRAGIGSFGVGAMAATSGGASSGTNEYNGSNGSSSSPRSGSSSNSSSTSTSGQNAPVVGLSFYDDETFFGSERDQDQTEITPSASSSLCALLICTDKHLISLPNIGRYPSAASAARFIRTTASSASAANPAFSSAPFASSSSSGSDYFEHQQRQYEKYQQSQQLGRSANGRTSLRNGGSSGSAYGSGTALFSLSMWENRITKQLLFGIPTSMSRDEGTGLLFFTVRSPVSAAAGGAGGPAVAATNSTGAGSMPSAAPRSFGGTRGSIVSTSSFTASALSGTPTGGAGGSSRSKKNIPFDRNRVSEHPTSFVVLDAKHRLANVNAPVDIHSFMASSSSTGPAFDPSSADSALAAAFRTPNATAPQDWAGVDHSTRGIYKGHDRNDINNTTTSMQRQAQRRVMKLTLSSAQMFASGEHSGPLVSVLPCVMANKVVSVDVCGTVAVWDIRSKNLPKVCIDTSSFNKSGSNGDGLCNAYDDNGSPAQMAGPDEPLHAYSKEMGQVQRGDFANIMHFDDEEEEDSNKVAAGGGLMSMRDLHAISEDHSEGEQEQNVTCTSSGRVEGGAAYDSPIQRSGSAHQRAQTTCEKTASKFAEDFEREVTDDPSMWSAGSPPPALLKERDTTSKAMRRLEGGEQPSATLLDRDIAALWARGDGAATTATGPTGLAAAARIPKKSLFGVSFNAAEQDDAVSNLKDAPPPSATASSRGFLTGSFEASMHMQSDDESVSSASTDNRAGVVTATAVGAATTTTSSLGLGRGGAVDQSDMDADLLSLLHNEGDRAIVISRKTGAAVSDAPLNERGVGEGVGAGASSFGDMFAYDSSPEIPAPKSRLATVPSIISSTKSNLGSSARGVANITLQQEEMSEAEELDEDDNELFHNDLSDKSGCDGDNDDIDRKLGAAVQAAKEALAEIASSTRNNSTVPTLYRDTVVRGAGARHGAGGATTDTGTETASLSPPAVSSSVPNEFYEVGKPRQVSVISAPAASISNKTAFSAAAAAVATTSSRTSLKSAVTAKQTMTQRRNVNAAPPVPPVRGSSRTVTRDSTGTGTPTANGSTSIVTATTNITAATDETRNDRIKQQREGVARLSQSNVARAKTPVHRVVAVNTAMTAASASVPSNKSSSNSRSASAPRRGGASAGATAHTQQSQRRFGVAATETGARARHGASSYSVGTGHLSNINQRHYAPPSIFGSDVSSRQERGGGGGGREREEGLITRMRGGALIISHSNPGSECNSVRNSYEF